jgi:hypothetical protein
MKTWGWIRKGFRSPNKNLTRYSALPLFSVCSIHWLNLPAEHTEYTEEILRMIVLFDALSVFSACSVCSVGHPRLPGSLITAAAQRA